MKKRTNYIWHIIILAIVITLLANIGLFHHFLKLHNLKAPSPATLEQYYFTIKIGSVGVITELLMLVVFTFFNYSWKNRLFKKTSVGFIIISNLCILMLFVGLKFLVFKYGTQTHPSLVFSFNFFQDFLINHSLVLTIAIVTPYMLLRMEKAREMELRLIKIQEEKATAELAALKEQISPHFFFNTLSTLSTIVRNETKKEILEFINDISDTYRYSLSSTKTDVVTVQEELDFIKSYAEILQKRFGEKLKITIQIPTTIQTSTIPPMAIQLLIENAIQHNIITLENPLRITVFYDDGYVCVKNNISPKTVVDSFGTGLMNLHNRYQLIAKKEIYIEQQLGYFLVKLPVLL
jgi:uncharacterized membrane protein